VFQWFDSQAWVSTSLNPPGRGQIQVCISPAQRFCFWLEHDRGGLAVAGDEAYGPRLRSLGAVDGGPFSELFAAQRAHRRALSVVGGLHLSKFPVDWACAEGRFGRVDRASIWPRWSAGLCRRSYIRLVLLGVGGHDFRLILYAAGWLRTAQAWPRQPKPELKRPKATARRPQTSAAV